jgi:hypothetical protein
MTAIPSIGARVELVHTTDPVLQAGSRGTVTGHGHIPGALCEHGRDETQVWVAWDDGLRVALLAGIDRWREVTDEPDRA